MNMSDTEQEAVLQDLRDILNALDLGDHARPISAHDVVQGEIIPAIHRLKQAVGVCMCTSGNPADDSGEYVPAKLVFPGVVELTNGARYVVYRRPGD